MPIRKHGKGFEVRVQHAGTRTSKTVGNRADAQQLERLWKSRIADRQVGRTPRYTLEEAFERWLTGEASLLRSHENLKDKVRTIYPHMRGKLLSDVVAVAEAVKSAGIKAELKPATINRRLAALRRVAKLAFRQWGWLEVDLGARVALLPGEQPRYVHASPDQARALLGATEGRGRAAILWACMTGLRKSELRTLAPGNFEDGAIVLTKGKTMKPRIVPLPAGLKADEFPFGLTEREIDEAFRAARKAIGRPDLQFRDLRRTFGSWIVQRTKSLKAAQELLGHTTPTITARHYAHLLAGDLADAMQTLPNLAGPARGTQKRKKVA